MEPNESPLTSRLPYKPRTNVSDASQFHWDTNSPLGNTKGSAIERSWHPKISPYRFLVVATMLILGTAKVIVIREGDSSNAPTTLEWIGGTLLSIFFFSLSGYDINISADHLSSAPFWLKWLFVPDCMEIIWSLFWVFSISPPRYISYEKESFSPSHSQPPITAYRILVCSVVIVFGMAKAVLSYLNTSTPIAPWLDWAMGVPISLILYCFGLYEYNSVDLWASFFITDRSAILYSANRGILYVFALMFCVAWTYMLGYGATLLSYHPSLLSELRNSGVDTISTFYKILGHEFLLAGMLAGTLAFLFIARRAVFSVTHRRGILRRTARLLHWALFGLMMRRSVSFPKEEENNKAYELADDLYEKHVYHSVYGVHFTPIIDLALYLVIHLSTYAFGIAVSLTLTLPGSPFINYSRFITFNSDPVILTRGGTVDLFVTALVWVSSAMALVCSVLFTLGLVVYALSMAVMMCEPFYYVYSHGAGKGMDDKMRMLKDRLVGLGPFVRLL